MKTVTCRFSIFCSMLAAAITVTTMADWNPDQPAKWIQIPDQSPSGVDVKLFHTQMPPPLWLADDFLCVTSGPISDIHIWGSWLYDQVPDPSAVSFNLSIWSDVPAGDIEPYSHPGTILWMTNITYPSYMVRKWMELPEPGEGWYDPLDGMYVPGADQMIWQYNFFLGASNAFVQEGSPEQPIIYWVAVQALVNDPTGGFWAFGWKTSPDNWNDDAVWAFQPGMWNELRYPAEHPLTGKSIDLAFVITTTNMQETLLDFGDAMDSVVALGYSTLLANNGARHTIVPGVHLGSTVDAEPDGQPTLNADGDDLNPPIGLDDEDGVIIPPVLAAGSLAQVQVTASVTGFLNAWIDWNANGTWIDPGEQVFLNMPLNPGLNTLALPVPIPPLLVAGGPQSRWRFTTYAPVMPAFSGMEGDGEVEDYEVHLEVLDFGDAPDPGYPTLWANDGARHRIPSAFWLGSAPDLEPDGSPDSQAKGDDNNNLDDEDAVAASATLIQGASKTVPLYVSTNGFLNLWIDFNQNGNWADAGEHLINDLAMVPGSNSVMLTAPATAALGNTFARMRFASVRGLGYTGLAPDGEVEDHVVTVYQAGPSTNIVITNMVYTTGSDDMTIEWTGETSVTYEAQYTKMQLDATNLSWNAWGGYVTGAPYRQTDTNPVETAKYYRVVAPWTP